MTYPEALEASWASGFFDGEGTTSFRKATRTSQGRGYKSGSQIRATIQQNDRSVLDRFQRAVGVGVVYGPYTRTSTQYRNRNPYYLYQAHTYDAVKQIQDRLFGTLGSIKKDQMERALQVWESEHDLES